MATKLSKCEVFNLLVVFLTFFPVKLLARLVVWFEQSKCTMATTAAADTIEKAVVAPLAMVHFDG